MGKVHAAGGLLIERGGDLAPLIQRKELSGEKNSRLAVMLN